MGSLKLTTASSGSVILSPENTASDVTITVPAVTGTMITTASTFAGTGPAFSAYANASQTVTANTWTKVTINTKDFDTANCFNNTTNYRFTPNVAGYYQVNAQLLLVGTVSSIQTVLGLYKNGGIYQRLIDTNPSASLSSNSNTTISGSICVYLNGTTDYIELYGYYFGGTSTFNGASSTNTSRFSAFLARSA